MEYAVKIDHLCKDFGAFALKDVSLAIPGGTILGLIGENGAGKSTVIKCLLGILQRDSGEISLLGQDGEAALTEVGYVPDECPFADVLKVKQVGTFLAGVFPHWDGALFQRYLEKFELSESKKVKELSRGMKMKLSIAAALAHHPKLLVLDEATSGLDPVIRDEILDEFLAFLADEDHAILISSHITSDLEKICDWVVYLHKGAVTVSGAKDELLDSYGKLSCSRADLERVDSSLVVGKRTGEFGCQALIKNREVFRQAYPELPLDHASLEDLMIFTTRGDKR
ncbi:MAG: ABC transporter ATP-binding protein [Pseudoflavonifractor sp.]|nr:ABC transporter ATP-binding protein [Pseudoflavonifractor sp.]